MNMMNEYERFKQQNEIVSTLRTTKNIMNKVWISTNDLEWVEMSSWNDKNETNVKVVLFERIRVAHLWQFGRGINTCYFSRPVASYPSIWTTFPMLSWCFF